MDGIAPLFDPAHLPCAPGSIHGAGETSRPRAKRPRGGNRSVPVPLWELDNFVTVVLFSGLGGSCAGLEEAGCPVHVANNHDDVALAAHAALHPHTLHIRGDVFDVDPLVATGGRPVKVMWCSPDCRDFSTAKGGAPRSPRVRSLPWQVCRWAAKTNPRVLFVENVREIRGWGPLVAKRCKVTGRVLKLDGTVAAPGERVARREQHLVRDPRRGGKTFRRWVRHIRALGYAFEDQDLNSADYGVPTARRRYFAVARRDGLPIRWPERTHAPRDTAHALGLLPWVAAATIIDWSLPLPSIFERKRPLAAATNRRLATGLKRFVLDNPRPFLVPEIAPVTLAYVAQGNGEQAVVGAWMVQHNSGLVGHAMHEPVSTLTTRGTQQQVGAGYLVKLRGTCTAQSVADPVPTLTAGNHVGAVAAFLQKYYGCGDGQACSEPLHTLATRDRFSVVAVQLDGQPFVVADIGMRMLEPHEAAAAHELTLPALVTIGGVRRPLTKTEKMRLIGNSVPKRMARLLAQANAVHTLSTGSAAAVSMAAD